MVPARAGSAPLTSTPTERGRPEQREAFLRGLVAHVLAEGVGAVSLRPLAAAVGTSDRMLLYYFRSRDGLLAAVLSEVADQLRAGLAGVLPEQPLPPAEVLAHAWSALQEPAFGDHLRLFIEIAGLAARGQEPFRSVAGQMFDTWTEWIGDRLDVPDHQRAGAAAAALAMIDGLLLTAFVSGWPTAEKAAGWLIPALGADAQDRRGAGTS